MKKKMKRVSIFLPAAVFAIVFVMVFLANCEQELIYNDFAAEKTEGGLEITKYSGNLRNVVIPAEIEGMPVVAIGNGVFSPFERSDNYMLQLASVTIPPSVTAIRPGVFRSVDLFGWFKTSGVYLSEGITIGANVTIMGENAVADWDQGWGALAGGDGNFKAYEAEHTGFWLDMGFVKFYNTNGRQAGKYTWKASYDSYNTRYTFTWTFTPMP